MIFQQVSVESGIDQLLRDEFANWSPAGARLIMTYLDEICDRPGHMYAFDRVEIRCQWSEYATIKDAAKAYGVTLKAMEDRTTVLKHDPKRDSSKVVVVMNY